MNLFTKAAEFEKLCYLAAKKAQTIDMNKPFRFDTSIPPASLSGPTSYSIPKSTPTTKPDEVVTTKSFAEKLMNFDPNQWNGVSVDTAALKNAGTELNTAILNKKPADILQALNKIMHLTRDGGGALYNSAKQFYDQTKQSMPKAPQPTFLDRYMKDEKSKWLDRYMEGEQLKDDADATKDAWKSSLESGHSLQDAFNLK